MPKKGTIVPYKGDQLTFEDFDPKSFSYAQYDQSELTGSHSDDFEPAVFGKKSKVCPSWGDREDCVLPPPTDHYVHTQVVWVGSFPILPFDYPKWNVRGLRGGCMARDLSGVYVGPAFESKKGGAGSPLAGPIEFPWNMASLKKPLTDDRVKAINAYVEDWEDWWSEHWADDAVQKELHRLTDELSRWQGLTLLHWCRALDPKNAAEKRAKCPTTTIIKAIELLVEEEF